ncbi:MAG: leucine-rich repeat protein [Bacteroidales bacterium]|nr:leucine-rich repeat protein [Bacteroidales bacterium]
MRHFIISLAIAIASILGASAQTQAIMGGSCGTDCKWTYDGYTLKVFNVNKKGLDVAIQNYNTSNQLAPWSKKKLDVRKVEIDRGINHIGSCAFANLPNLQEVVFNDPQLNSIGWGAFLNCKHLRTISLPVDLKNIETIAFANCDALASIKIPDQCRIGDQAFASCDNLKSIELSPTAILGHYVFAGETEVDGKPRHTLYNHEVRRIPAYINMQNANEYGLAPASIEKLVSSSSNAIDYDYETSDLDKMIPVGPFTRNNTYALVIGNQNYRFVSDVPYAIHDARVFADYCRKTLGIPAENIHVTEDATKQMILEEELQDWLGTINDPEDKNLIIYYAGHGVPDVKNQNKAYLLPTDVRGTSPQRGIALDEFYKQLGDLAFNQTTVFLDACFSGVNRENEGVTEGLRAVEVDAENAELGGGNVVVFSAAQGNETAQGFPEEGHGLFTYYLLKELRDSYGETTLGNLSDAITHNVSQKAPQMKMRKSQTPSTNASDVLGDKWRRLRF